MQAEDSIVWAVGTSFIIIWIIGAMSQDREDKQKASADIQSRKRSVVIFPSKHAVFLIGLSLLAILCIYFIVKTFFDFSGAPTTLAATISGSDRARIRYVQIELLEQHPREPTFEARLMLYIDDFAEVGDGNLAIRVSQNQGYGDYTARIPIIFDGSAVRFRSFHEFGLTTSKGSHPLFPFDTSVFDLELSVDPSLPVEFVRLVNRVPGFYVDKESFDVRKTENGAIGAEFVLRRHPFIPLVAILLIVTATTFGFLILLINNIEALAPATASYFFSIWSIQGIIGTHVKTFPTLLDYALVIICSFLLLGLLWKLLLLRSIKTRS